MKKIKVCLSNVNLNSTSGPNTFGGRLANQLLKDGHEIIPEETIQTGKKYYKPAECMA